LNENKVQKPVRVKLLKQIVNEMLERTIGKHDSGLELADPNKQLL